MEINSVKKLSGFFRALSSKYPQKSLEKFSDLNWLYDDFKKEFNISFPAKIIDDFNPAKMSIYIYLDYYPMELLQETK